MRRDQILRSDSPLDSVTRLIFCNVVNMKHIAESFRKRFAFRQATNTILISKSLLRGRCPTNLLGFLQSFATRCAFFPRGERIRRRRPSLVTRVGYSASRRAELSRKAQGDYIKFFSPFALSLALSRHTPFSVVGQSTPVSPRFQLPPSDPSTHANPFECLLACSSSVSITRRPPNKSIPPHPVRVNGTFGLCTARLDRFSSRFRKIANWKIEDMLHRMLQPWILQRVDEESFASNYNSNSNHMIACIPMEQLNFVIYWTFVKNQISSHVYICVVNKNDNQT